MRRDISHLAMIGLAACGIVASYQPWSGVYMGSLPPGNIPDTIFYGYEVNGKYCAACFAIIIGLCLVSLIKRVRSKKLTVVNLLLAGLALIICGSDILKIALQPSMTGTVPYLLQAPYLVAFLATVLIVLSGYHVAKPSKNL